MSDNVYKTKQRDEIVEFLISTAENATPQRR